MIAKAKHFPDPLQTVFWASAICSMFFSSLMTEFKKLVRCLFLWWNISAVGNSITKIRSVSQMPHLETRFYCWKLSVVSFTLGFELLGCNCLEETMLNFSAWLERNPFLLLLDRPMNLYFLSSSAFWVNTSFQCWCGTDSDLVTAGSSAALRQWPGMLV